MLTSLSPCVTHPSIARLEEGSVCSIRDAKAQIRSGTPILNREFQGQPLVAGPSSCLMRGGNAGKAASLPRRLAAHCSSQKTASKLRLKLDHQVAFGQHHAVVGSSGPLGKWKKPVAMQWREDGWNIELPMQAGEQVEFKFVIVSKDGDMTWEDGDNRRVEAPEGDACLVEVEAVWNQTDAVDAKVTRGAQSSSEAASSGGGSTNGNAPKNTNGAAPSSGTSGFAQAWQGREINFMRSNSHSRDRQGRWETEGLEGAALALVRADKDAGNWWRKLENVQNVITGDLAQQDNVDVLVHCHTYLQWINTGALACVEDGGHRRPNRHAEISRVIFRQLERVTGSKDSSLEAVLVARRVHLRLPAFSAEFTASVPLTRIRDIAHRNDIPHDLKQEIKHTIQNKLHRNAGPEDLIATESLLARIRADRGQYTPEFVEQLEIFTQELREFFNATDLVDRLQGLRSGLDEQGERALASFLEKKERLDGGGGEGTAEPLVTGLHALTGLRAVLLKGLESGVRNDAPDSALAARQTWRLAEIGLENYSFVLLSRLCNALEEGGGGAAGLAAGVRAGSMGPLAHALGGVVLGIRQLGLSGWKQAECIAVENEIGAWQKAGVADPDSDAANYAILAARSSNGSAGVHRSPDEALRVWGLRLKATLERARRLVEGYSDAVLSLYSKRSQVLGTALGIPENTVRTFAESEIRASVVFQLARLLSLLLKTTRVASGASGWDPLNTGVAVGRLLEVERIEPGALAREEGPLVLLVKSASGDEEVKSASEGVVGVVLCQELPHLSHLGVRARQEGVVFVTCEDEDAMGHVRSMLGQTVRLEATGDSASVQPASAVNGSAKASASSDAGAAGQAKVAPSQVKKQTGVLSLTEARVENVGSKAAACGTLATLAQASSSVPGALFRTPAGACLPFGTMEAALEAAGQKGRFEELVRAVEGASVEGGELDRVCADLERLLGGLTLAPADVSALEAAFPGEPRLIVRSSANVEDLAGMSAAGLYESIPNVRTSDPSALSAAVARVWGSLFARRAVLSRRAAGVRQSDATMAVLVQELLSPTLSFVLHTVETVEGNADLVEAEIALGLGETLAAGTRGSPWRLAASKTSATVRTKAFANFSHSLVAGARADGSVLPAVIDYSKQELSTDPAERTAIGLRLAAVGVFLERKMGGPQDVEGCMVGGDIYVVQSRPQPL